MSKFPETIKIKIVDTVTKQPIEGVVLMLHLFANHKNDYDIILNASNCNGLIIVSKDWLWEKVLEIISTSIMDFSSNLEDCKPFIEIMIMDDDAINRAIEGTRVWWRALKSPQEDIENLKLAKNSLYKPVSRMVNFNDSDELEVVLETQRIK